MRGTSLLALVAVLLLLCGGGCATMPLSEVGTVEQSLVRQIQAEVSAIRELNAHFAALHAEITAQIGGDLAGIKSSVGGDAVGIKTTATQKAGGNINDAWTSRLAVIGAAASGPMSTAVYIGILRPMRRRRKLRREKEAGESAGEFGLPITARISFAVDRQSGGGQAPLRADQP